jgi:hypothetical protein
MGPRVLINGIWYYGSYSHWNGIDVGVGRIRADGGIDFSGTDHISANTGRFSAEGEYYLTRWTLSGLVGVETASINSGVLPLSVPNRFFDDVSASYYVTDNFKLSVGRLYTFGRNGR